jgi:hypothetical protein
MIWAMDIGMLKLFGQIGGLAGLCLGVLLLVFRDIIRKNIFPRLTRELAYRLFRLIAILVWSLAVLGLGTWAYSNFESTFPMTIFVHGSGGPQDTVLQNSGEVLIDLGGDRQKAAIGDKGQAFFPAIPANFRGQEVLVSVSSDKFESVEANKKYKLDRQAIYLSVRRKAGRLYGLVDSEDPKCLVGVQLQVAGLAVPVNSDSGRFDVSIPGDRLQDELVLDATGPGCTPQHINVVLNSNELRITLHRSPAGSAKE